MGLVWMRREQLYEMPSSYLCLPVWRRYSRTSIHVARFTRLFTYGERNKRTHFIVKFLVYVDILCSYFYTLHYWILYILLLCEQHVVFSTPWRFCVILFSMFTFGLCCFWKKSLLWKYGFIDIIGVVAINNMLMLCFSCIVNFRLS